MPQIFFTPAARRERDEPRYAAATFIVPDRAESTRGGRNFAMRAGAQDARCLTGRIDGGPPATMISMIRFAGDTMRR